MGRYSDKRTINNDTAYYRSLVRKRGVKSITHFTTPILHNPTVAQRANVQTTAHIWTYGDRFYKLAYQFYGDPGYWWVIAWYNGRPTEVDISPGDVIEIPLEITEALDALGA